MGPWMAPQRMDCTHNETVLIFPSTKMPSIDAPTGCHFHDGLLPGLDERPADVIVLMSIDITRHHKAKLRKYEESCDAEAITFLLLNVSC